MWLIMTPVTCVTIQLETATSPLLTPTTTLNLKSPLPCCCAHGKYPLWVKPGTLTPPSPPLFAPPLVQGCGHSWPLPHHLHWWWAINSRCINSKCINSGCINSRCINGGCINGVCINSGLLMVGVSTAGYWRRVYQWWAIDSRCINGGRINSGLSTVDVLCINGGHINGGHIQQAYLTHEAVFHPTYCLLYQEGPKPQWGNLFCIIIRLFS